MSCFSTKVFTPHVIFQIILLNVWLIKHQEKLQEISLDVVVCPQLNDIQFKKWNKSRGSTHELPLHTLQPHFSVWWIWALFTWNKLAYNAIVKVRFNSYIQRHQSIMKSLIFHLKSCVSDYLNISKDRLKKAFKTQMSNFWEEHLFICTKCLVRAPLASIAASVPCVVEEISLLRCDLTQVVLPAAFSSSVFLVRSFSLLETSHRFSMSSGQVIQPVNREQQYHSQ